MTRPRFRPSRPLAAAVCLLVATAAAQAQAPEPTLNPAIRTIKPSKIVPGRDVPMADRAGGAIIEPPKLPPIDLASVPPMPMPLYEADPDPSRTPTNTEVVIYDGSTGEMQVVPRGWTSPSGKAGGPSIGAFEALDDALPTASWNSTMSPVSQAGLGAFPARANVKLIMRFVNAAGSPVYYHCSGTMIDSGTVLTAAHCFFNRGTNGEPALGWATRVWILPAWDGDNLAGQQPSSSEIQQRFGWSFGESFLSSTGWTEFGNPEYDIGAIAVSPGGRSVGALTGWMGWYWGQCGIDTPHHNFSYPGEDCDAPLHTGRQMYYWWGEPDVCPTMLGIHSFGIFTTPGCLTAVWGGMSGSSLYRQDPDGPFIGAVCSLSDRRFSARYCGLWDEFAAGLDAFVDYSRGNVADYELLRYRIGAEPMPTVFSSGPIGEGQVLLVNPTNADPPPATLTVRVRHSLSPNLAGNDIGLLGVVTFDVDLGPRDSVLLDIPSFDLEYFVPAGTRYVGVELAGSPDANPLNNATMLWDMQPITVEQCQPPGTPTGLEATDGEFCDRVRLTWNPGGGAEEYRVWRRALGDPSFQLIATVVAPLYDDYDEPPAGGNGGYFYKVQAANFCGTSNSSSLDDFGYRANPVVGVPANVAATDGTRCDGVNVTWQAAAYASSYSVLRNTVNSPVGATQIAGGITGLSHLDASASAGTTYHYFVRAHNACTASAPSTGNEGRRQGFLSTLGVVQVVNASCLGVELAWNPTPGATGYAVFRGTTNDPFVSSYIATVSGNAYTDTTSPPGVPHYYWVKAGNICGFSPFDFSATPRTPVAKPGLLPPPGLVVASDPPFCTPFISVTWEEQPGAVRYRVLRTSPRGGADEVGITTQTTFEDRSADPGVSYDYSIVCVDGCGQSGAPSRADSGNRGGPPPPPLNVRAGDAPSCQSVIVSWDASPGATSYEIRRGATSDPGRAMRVGESPSSPFVDQSAPAGVEMFYFVVAASPCGDSPAGEPDAGAAHGRGQASIARHPENLSVDAGHPASFEVLAGGATAWAWTFNGQPLSDGRGISGVATAMLTIDAAGMEHAGRYACVVTTACGTVTSEAAELTVVPPPPCFADFNQDGGVDGDDVSVFFAAWETGDASADTNLDGGIDGSDVDVFFHMWEAGGC